MSFFVEHAQRLYILLLKKFKHFPFLCSLYWDFYRCNVWKLTILYTSDYYASLLEAEFPMNQKRVMAKRNQAITPSYLF